VRVTRPSRTSSATRATSKAAQVFAGHESIQTTADIYAHFDLADLREALQLVAERRSERRAQADDDRTEDDSE
jgi:integrase